jgi:hypothetical protein
MSPSTTAKTRFSFLNERDVTPDLVTATVIDTLTEEEAEGFGFRPGDIRNVADA